MAKCGFCTKDAIVSVLYDDKQEDDVCRYHYHDIYNSCDMIAITKVLDPNAFFEEDS